MQLWKLLTTVAVWSMVSCSSNPTVSENQCRAGDWQTIGYRDGASGYQSTHLLAHQEACGQFGIVPQRSGYLSGWNEGLSIYCTADNGFLLGQRGAAFNTVCNAERREPYASAYDNGRQLYLARQEVINLNHQIDHHVARLEYIKKDMVAVTTAQLTADLTTQERISLLAELEALASERATIKAELPHLEQALADAQDKLDRVSKILFI